MPRASCQKDAFVMLSCLVAKKTIDVQVVRQMCSSDQALTTKPKLDARWPLRFIHVLHARSLVYSGPRACIRPARVLQFKVGGGYLFLAWERQFIAEGRLGGPTLGACTSWSKACAVCIPFGPLFVPTWARDVPRSGLHLAFRARWRAP